MDVVNAEFLPDPDASREVMERQQREIASTARFVDAFSFDPDAIEIADASADSDRPVVAGVDQAFLDDRAVSAVVCLQGGTVVERASAVTSLSVPYIPGLLAFREGGPIVAALSKLSVDPDLLVLDGSGRIHYREAGLATHIGVVFDTPAIGVAKNLLCGEPAGETSGLSEGSMVPVYADEEMEVPGEDLDSGDGDDETIVGYAVQTRQYASANRHVNPLWVSPGHRVSASTAASLVLAMTAGYKLPEPTRLADAYADEVKAEIS